MNKDLENWIRGTTIQEAAPAATPAFDPWLLAAPVEDVADEVLNDVLIETAEEPTEELEESFAEDSSIEETDETPVEDVLLDEPDYEPDLDEVNNIDSVDSADSEKKPAWELLEESGARLAMRLRQLRDAKYASHFYQRSGLREGPARFLTLLLLVVIVIGTAMALYRNMQRTSFSAMMEMARELYSQEQYEDAFEAFSETARKYPDRSEPFLGTAHSAERMGRVDDAITAYRAALELFPANAAHLRSNAFYEIGRLYAVLKAWDKAQENFEQAIAADIVNHRAYFSLGDSLEEQNQPEKAILAYRQALELSPSSDAAREAIRRVELAMASKEEAEKNAALEREFQQSVQSGGVALEGGRFREASDHFAAALAIRSDDADAWVGFAEARGKLGDSNGEIRSLERALERDPEHQRAKSRLEEIRRRNAPPRQNTPRQNNQRRAPRSRRNTAPRTRETVARTALFEAGVELYRKGEYGESFNSFVACLRSPERGPLPSAPLAGDPGPIWKGSQVSLIIPADAKLLAEAVQLNPTDRDLYVNLSMAGAKMGLDRVAMRSTLSEARYHALHRASN